MVQGAAERKSPAGVVVVETRDYLRSPEHAIQMMNAGHVVLVQSSGRTKRVLEPRTLEEFVS